VNEWSLLVLPKPVRRRARAVGKESFQVGITGGMVVQCDMRTRLPMGLSKEGSQGKDVLTIR